MKRVRLTVALVAMLVLPVVAGPSPAAAATVPTPVVTVPPDGLRGFALFDSYYDLAPFGYEDQEYFVSGTAIDAAGRRPRTRRGSSSTARPTGPSSTAPCSSTGST